MPNASNSPQESVQISSSDEYQHPRMSSWLVFGLTITAIYLLVFIVVLLPSASTCSEIGPMPSWFSSTFSCMTLNEMGDFFAGASAPLAFIWLAVAVLIQAQELRAQREELQLTRMEYAETRMVLDEQTRQMKYQTETLITQTKILFEQEKQRERLEKEEKFIAEIVDICQLLSSGKLLPNHFGYIDNDGQQRTAGDYIPSQYNPVTESAEYLREFGWKLNEINDFLETDSAKKIKPQIDLFLANETINKISKLVEKAKRFRAAMRKRNEIQALIRVNDLLIKQMKILNDLNADKAISI